MSPILAVVIILALVIIAVLGSGWLIKSKIRFPSKLQLKILSSQELEEQISSALDEYEPELNQLGVPAGKTSIGFIFIQMKKLLPW